MLLIEAREVAFLIAATFSQEKPGKSMPSPHVRVAKANLRLLGGAIELFEIIQSEPVTNVKLTNGCLMKR